MNTIFKGSRRRAHIELIARATERLRELEKEGIIRRELFAEIPPKVEYSLTKKGTELAKNSRTCPELGRKMVPCGI
jgi:DNA-binding HxlR family transcriptional regulator